MKTRVLSLVLLLTSTALLTACPNETTVSRLNADPARYRNKDVVLAGRVTTSFGALGQGVYELDDETGRIFIITDRGVPARGARIQTAGRLVSGVTWNGRTYGTALRETGRRVRD